jgi:Asp-tRNA(Asn)/Glu-tRNA(Gln) amidotransferase B subunit
LKCQKSQNLTASPFKGRGHGKNGSNPLYFLIGHVMKSTRGKADPTALTELIQKKLRG